MYLEKHTGEGARAMNFGLFDQSYIRAFFDNYTILILSSQVVSLPFQSVIHPEDSSL